MDLGFTGIECIAGSIGDGDRKLNFAHPHAQIGEAAMVMMAIIESHMCTRTQTHTFNSAIIGKANRLESGLFGRISFLL